MSRNLTLLALLLAGGLGLADEASGADPVPSANEEQAQSTQEQAQSTQEPAQSTQEQSTDEKSAQEQSAQEKSKDEAKLISGMSILGNQDAPKSLVIVPWKSSQLGASLGLSTLLDDSRQPVDKDVFMRELSYYEIRSHNK